MNNYMAIRRRMIQTALSNVPTEPTYITFSSDSSFTLNVYDNTKHWDGTLYYSTDATTWAEWTGATTLSSVGNKLYLRGSGNAKITGSSTNYRWVLIGSGISCAGNIENLLDWEAVQAGSHPSMTDYCYSSMFRGCTSLATAPALPATALARNCYQYMFEGCTSLATAPALPATALANDCYGSMFEGCTSLATAPALPATALANYCYQSMFRGCTSLATAPALPVTALANGCYNRMFEGCTSLATAPALPATAMTSYCYTNMFYGCTSLATAPALPATALESYCYNRMFEGCTSLATAPALPATALASNCYNRMLRGCTSFRVSATQTGTYQYAWRIPTSGSGVSASSWNTAMLEGTGGTFTSYPSINTTYYVENPPV